MTEAPNTPDTPNEADTVAETVDIEIASPEARIAELEAEVAKFKDQALRALAEQENVRRRAQRDREDALKFATSAFAKDLVTVADNLRRAIDSVPEAQAAGDELLKGLLSGVSATERELLGAFEKHGIRKLDPLGEKFDHNFHQAIFELENTGKVAGTVVQVLQAGYTLHDRLLREAMVGVAKGPVADGAATDGKPADDKGTDGHQRVDRTA
ncbi:MAG TPA: nucleotide exchange factor GrpE [Aliidongia sp.]|uniref:nucleotide exchange factor GrpE n=1 Tax=Aliidongia sp. TaxID=1914230 RepID=UPI002DDD46F4|nr:nucleotide exchange factor GrpE [Aliidongia sp.]HEV2673709.1 nucleotide exchange factor GrpE [Aliidongia sp.]